MDSRRHAPKPEILSMFLENLKRRILKKRYAKGWGFTRSKSLTAYF
jgi:hypothetical protein